MKEVNLLDCTLRDGGYVNDWNFGHSVITGTYRRLDLAGVDYIEVGFLDDRREFDSNRSIQPNTECFNKLFHDVPKKHAVPVAMIDYGTCDISNIQPREGSFIEGIRVIFKKEKIDQALPFCRKIKEKGYKLFIQAISITAYTDLEMLEYIQKINIVKPYAFSIVDTYGLLDSRKLTNYFNLLNNNLDPEIRIGYHAHNNFQLAFSNSIKFLALETKRPIIVDSTVYGMGKSAGNCASELIGLHLNQKYEKNYDIDQFLEIFDTDLSTVYQRHYWGYKYNFYISAMQNCHPNYVQYLLDKKTLSVSSVNEILDQIPAKKKLLYDKKFIEEAYIQYQSKSIDDTAAIRSLRNSFAGKSIVLLGPGKSLQIDKDRIRDYIFQMNAFAISVNFEPTLFDCGYVFLSNAKRYSKLVDMRKPDASARLLVTSNITPFDRPADYILNYSSLMADNGVNSDNALLLCLSLLIKSGVRQVSLAGFDGFQANEQNYFVQEYSFTGNETYALENNRTTIEGIRELSKKIKITFITKSMYEEGLK